ncbi:MAG TPA: DUF1501 domain-containing protein [Polyangiaceae bacterium]|jgi:uncharacterized protein (DUF1501 family)
MSIRFDRRTLFRMGTASAWSLMALSRAAQAEPRPADRRVLVCVFMRGAVDGLSMVVPYAEPSYYRDRSSIAIQRPGKGDGAALDLDGRFALNPRLAALLPIYRAKELAVVHAVGLPTGTRSHFDAQDEMEIAGPDVHTAAEGWLSRALGELPRGGLERSIALGDHVPRALSGTSGALLVRNLEGFDLHGPGRMRDAMHRGFERLYGESRDALGQGGRDALYATRMLQALDPKSYQPKNGANYPDKYKHLRDAAQLIKSNLDVQVVWLDAGGWDTHAGQGGADGSLGKKLEELGRALAAFRADLDADFGRVTLVTMTEFGRTVAENGTGGTDHGHGSLMMVMGGAVNGGQVAGRWPGLEPEQRFEERDLAVTTDYRDVLGEVSTHCLGVSNFTHTFPGYTPNFLGVVRS